MSRADHLTAGPPRPFAPAGPTTTPAASRNAPAGPLGCPSCGAALPTGAYACTSCGLGLVGPAAAELWRIDQQLVTLHRRRHELIDWLRRQPPSAPPPPGAAGTTGAARPSWSGQQVLLAAGALLVLTAAAVFVAVAWSTIGVGGQVAAMAALTATAGGVSLRLARGRLTSTAEALGALAVGMGAVDLVAAHSLDLAGLGSVDELWYVTAAAGLLALGCAGVSRAAARLVCFPLASALAAAAVPLLAVAAAEPTGVITALALVLAASATALAAEWLPLRRPVQVVLVVAANGYLVGGWVAADVTVLDRPLLGAGGLAALVSLAGCAAAGWWSGAARGTRSSRRSVRDGTALLTAAMVAAVVTIDTAVGSADPSALATAVVAAVAPAAAVGLSFRTPTGPTARDGMTRATRTAVLGLHLLAGTELLLAGGRYLEDWPLVRSPLSWSLAAALLVTALAAGLLACRAGTYRWLVAGYAALLVLGAGVVGAAPSGTVWTAAVLAALAVLAGGLSAWRHGQRAETLFGTTWVVATAGALAAASSSTAPALPVAVILAAAGLTASAYALLPQRGHLAVLASLLCSAAVWTLLLDAEVHTVEAYSLPLAGLLGVVGLVRLHREPSAPSWLTVGPALAVGMLPSAVASVSDPEVLRPLLVLAAGAAVLLLGVSRRWQAPLVIGSLGLAVVAVSQLAPWAVGLPRWLSFGTVGLVLLVLGARYEERRRNARRAVDWVAALR